MGSAHPPRIRPATPAWVELAEALTTTKTPCIGGTAWTSEDATERAAAVVACRACPLLDLCAEAAASTRETFGVWAGRDRTAQPGRPRRSA